MNESEILLLFQNRKQEKAFLLLYKVLPQFKAYVKSQGGSIEQSKDIFQDALLVFYKKIKEENFQFNGSLKTYLVNTAKYMWWKENKQHPKSEFVDVDFHQDDGADIEALFDKESKITAAEKVIESLGDKCKQILEAFYYKSHSMKDIAKNFGYSSEKSAKNQKYKCLERARKQLINA